MFPWLNVFVFLNCCRAIFSCRKETVQDPPIVPTNDFCYLKVDTQEYTFVRIREWCLTNKQVTYICKGPTQRCQEESAKLLSFETWSKWSTLWQSLNKSHAPKIIRICIWTWFLLLFYLSFCPISLGVTRDFKIPFNPYKTKEPTLSLLRTWAISADFIIWKFWKKFLGWMLINLIYMWSFVSCHFNQYCKS